MLSVKMFLAKAICRNQVKFGDDTAEKFVSDDAKKAIAETTQLLENVVEQLSESGMIGLTYETLKMRKKVHQIKEKYEVLEKLQELSKEIGKDNTELRNFAAKFNRQDATAQLEHPNDELLWRPRLRRLPRGMPEVRNPDETRGETFFLSYNKTKRTMKFTW